MDRIYLHFLYLCRNELASTATTKIDWTEYKNAKLCNIFSLYVMAYYPIREGHYSISVVVGRQSGMEEEATEERLCPL